MEKLPTKRKSNKKEDGVKRNAKKRKVVEKNQSLKEDCSSDEDEEPKCSSESELCLFSFSRRLCTPRNTTSKYKQVLKPSICMHYLARR